MLAPEDLKVKKLCPRWVPHDLAEELKQRRVWWCQEMLKFDSRTSKRLHEVVTGDETSIYQFSTQTKKQPSVRCLKMKNLQHKSSSGGTLAKNGGHIFFHSKSDHIVSILSEEQKTVTSNWYTEICLPKVIKKLVEKQPKEQETLFCTMIMLQLILLKKRLSKTKQDPVVWAPTIYSYLALWDFYLLIISRRVFVSIIFNP